MHRVRQVDLRRLAAEFHRQSLHGRRGLGDDLAARHGGTGERDHVDGGVTGEQPSARDAFLDDDAQDSGGQPGRIGRGAEDQRRDRGQRARPQDDRVAGHQGGNELLKTHQQCGVVGRDGRHHADRLVPAHAEGDAPTHELVDRHGAGLFVRHRQVQVDGVASQRQPAADLCHARRTPSAVRPRPPGWGPSVSRQPSM